MPSFYALLYTSSQFIPLSLWPWLCLVGGFIPPTVLAPLLFLFFLFCSSFPPVFLASVWKGFVLTDTQQDYHHSTQETTHLSLHPPSFHPSTNLSIHRLPLFLDFCYPTPGPAQVSLPFPPLSLACVWTNLCISPCLFVCHFWLIIKSAPAC